MAAILGSTRVYIPFILKKLKRYIPFVLIVLIVLIV
ncbi:MAG: hypothetical protein ACI88H_001879, partial [Cocleimonas sp.]